MTCDPVFAAANVGFEHQIHDESDQGITRLLWEASAALSAARYPGERHLSRWRSEGVGPRVYWLGTSSPRYREDDVLDWLERVAS